MTDLVNHPAHYTEHPSGIECIQVTEHMGFCIGNAIKYLWRADLKGNAIQDLEKAAWYIQREIARRTEDEAWDRNETYPKYAEVGKCAAITGDTRNLGHGFEAGDVVLIRQILRVEDGEAALCVEKDDPDKWEFWVDVRDLFMLG